MEAAPPPEERQPLRPRTPASPSHRGSISTGMILREHGFIKQVIVASCASLGYLAIGLVRGFSSPAVPSMSANSPHIVPDHQAISWISASPPLGAFLGSLAAGPLMQRFGRRGALFAGSPLFALSWLAISLSTTPATLIAARAVTGIAGGIVLPAAQVYVSECSDPRIRGRLSSMPALFMAGGVLASYLLGYFLTWELLALVSALSPSLLFLSLFLLPESPAWLNTKARYLEAHRALEWLRITSHSLPVELSAVNEEVKQPTEPVVEKTLQAKVILKSAFSPDELLKKSVTVPFGLVIAILIFQQLSGIDTIIFYTVSIFQASGSTMGEYEATIVIGAVQMLATCVSSFFIDRFGRKLLLLLSGIVMFFSMASLGCYFYLYSRGRADGFGMVPLASQMVFITGFSIGYCNVPFILMGELLPAKQRSFLSSIAGAINLGAMFLVIKTYPDIKTQIGSEGAFWLYAAFCLLSCFFVGFLLPETKGKSLDEIEALFSGNAKDNDDP